MILPTCLLLLVNCTWDGKTTSGMSHARDPHDATAGQLQWTVCKQDLLPRFNKGLAPSSRAFYSHAMQHTDVFLSDLQTYSVRFTYVHTYLQ